MQSRFKEFVELIWENDNIPTWINYINSSALWQPKQNKNNERLVQFESC